MSLLDSTLDTIGQVGEGLDKFTGGRAMRGALAGKPRELLSVLPFSDTAGITNPEEKTSGRDVTDYWNLTTKGDTSLGSRAAGLGADILLNPANLAGGIGAFRAAPTALKGLGAAASEMSGLNMVKNLPNLVKAPFKAATGLLADERGAIGSPSALRSLTESPYEGFRFKLLDDIAKKFNLSGSEARRAVQAGPQYGGGIGKIREIASADPESAPYLMDYAKSNPKWANALANELEPGAKILGEGVTAAGFLQPSGGVVRAQRGPDLVARLLEPEMIHPYRSAQVAGSTFEHLPSVKQMSSYIDPLHDLKTRTYQAGNLLNANDPMHAGAQKELLRRIEEQMNAMYDVGGNLSQGLIRRGIRPADLHEGNYGLTPDLRAAVLDPGALQLPGTTEHENVINQMMGQPSFEKTVFGHQLYPERYATPMMPVRGPKIGNPRVVDWIRKSLQEQGAAGSRGMGVPSGLTPEFMIGPYRENQGLFEAVQKMFGPRGTPIGGSAPEFVNLLERYGARPDPYVAEVQRLAQQRRLARGEPVVEVRTPVQPTTPNSAWDFPYTTPPPQPSPLSRPRTDVLSTGKLRAMPTSELNKLPLPTGWSRFPAGF